VAAGPTVKQLFEAYPDKIRLVVKNYPYKYRDYSRIAAAASLAAREQGKYWEMHDLLLERSPHLDRASLLEYATELGLDLARFTAAIDSDQFAAEIDRDIQLAESIDLYNTPTFYINGRQVVGERPLAFFQKIIDEELQQSGG
jgi:protein-disulfide isomerase